VSKATLAAQHGLTGRYVGGPGSAPVTRIEPGARFAFGATPPVPYPVRGEWRGTICMPAYGDYQFPLVGDGDAELFLDGRPAGSLRKGLSTPGVLRLAMGRHLVLLRGTLRNNASTLVVRWQSNWTRHEPPIQVGPGEIPAERLAHEEMPWGVREIVYPSEVRGTEIWEERIWPVLYYQHGVYPKPQPIFALEWRAFLHVAQAGQYRFEANCNSATQLLIDDKIVVGQLENERGSGQAILAAGEHRLLMKVPRAVNEYVNVGLFWTPPGGKHEVVPHDALRPAP